MVKKSAFCFFIFALLLGSSNLFAQKPGHQFSAGSVGQFSVAPPKGGIVKVPEGVDLGLQNAAELTPEEFRAALEKSTCGGEAKVDKAPFACYACTDFNCFGTCYEIPCGFYINANQQVPPVAGFRSFVTGCTTTYVSPCNDLSCQVFAFDSAVVGDNVCINSNQFLLQSVGCL